MMINSISSSTVSRSNDLKEKQSGEKSGKVLSSEEQAAVLELGKAPVGKATYSKPKAKGLNADEINRLKQEAQSSFNVLRNLVEGLINRQGKKLEDLLSGKEVLLVDEETRAAAAEMVSEDGELGIKAVSERIVSFAKALAGDDSSKAGELRNAIIQGFKEAEKALGGKLPEISQKTYDEVMRQLDEWEKQ